MQRLARWLVLATILFGVGQIALSALPALAGDPARDTTPNDLTNFVFLPLIGSPTDCPAIPGESFSTLTVNPPPTDRPAEQHADLNLALRGYAPTTGYLGLVDIPGPTDTRSPQLPGLFADNRTATFRTLYQVYDWDWTTNSPGAPITDPPVSLAGLAVGHAEPIRVPDSGYNIGNALRVPRAGTAFEGSAAGSGAFEVLVLYAAPDRITLKYTRDDNVVHGYTLHLEAICVEPRVLALYEQWNASGRKQLPALRAGQALGTARADQIGVAIRDTGSFMDPRSRKDWWQGR